MKDWNGAETPNDTFEVQTGSRKVPGPKSSKGKSGQWAERRPMDDELEIDHSHFQNKTQDRYQRLYNSQT
jgi:hypothetical protein